MSTIEQTRFDDIVLLTINRPQVMNALNTAVYQELADILMRIDADFSIQVVILTGKGEKAFAAGADIGEMKDLDAQGGWRFSRLSQRPADLLASMRQVSIAAVNGYALGGGFELTLACDLCIASEHAVFAMPEVGLGIIPSGGGTQRLTHVVGARRAKELIFTGRQIGAREAETLGLVNRVVPARELIQQSLDLGKEITTKSSTAVCLAKRSIEASLDLDLKNGSDQESLRQGLAFAGEDRKERMLTFLDRK